MSILSERSGIHRTHNLSPRRGTTRPQDTEIPENTQIYENEKWSTALHWVRTVLQKLHTPSFRKNRPVPPDHQVGRSG